MFTHLHRSCALIMVLLAGLLAFPMLAAPPSPAPRDGNGTSRVRPRPIRAPHPEFDEGDLAPAPANGNSTLAFNDSKPARASDDDRPARASDEGYSAPAPTDGNPAPLTPDQRAQNFPNDIPAGEIDLGSLFGTVPGQDAWAWAAGRLDGQLVLLTGEAFAIKAAHSDDGGASFGSEVLVAGGPGQSSATTTIYSCAATLSPDGKLYLAYKSGDPQGDTDLRFVRSDDMGRTWTAPLDLVKHGDPQHGLGSGMGIAANGAGRVAVVFSERWERKDSYVMASSDGGQSWTPPVRLDRGDTSGTSVSARAAVAVDAAGNIYAVFRANRGQGTQIWFTRSTDGGVTFDTERNFDSVLPPGERKNSDCPALAVANDGSVLVAFWDRFGSRRLYGVRSTDGGGTFTKTFQTDLIAGSATVWPRLVVSPGTATVLLGLVRTDQQLIVWRSPDNGASFGSGATVVTSAYRSPWGVTSNSPTSEIGFARTGAGRWLVAWEDARSAGADSTLTDIYARVSTDDGVSWGAEQRVDRYPPGASESRLMPAVTSTGTDDLFVGYLDRRDGEGTQWNVYANRSQADPVDFSRNERRVDQDSFTDNYFGTVDYNDAAVTTDGVSHVYVTMTRTVAGAWSDIYVAASPDRGRTFPVLRRVSTNAAGTANCIDPQINAYPDGTVYVAFLIKSAGGTQLVFNRSRDFGQTWLTSQIVVASATSWDYGWGTFRLVSQTNGSIYLVWSNVSTVFLSRSSNGGDTFSTQDIDQDTRGENFNPALCAQGDEVFVVFASPNDTNEYYSVFAVVSPDRGATWGPRTQLRPEGVYADAYDTDVACDGTSAALAVWNDFREGGLHASRYDGTSSGWQTDSFINSPANGCLTWPRALFVTPGIVLVSYTNFCGSSVFDSQSVWLSRSVDGGATFGAPLQVDQAAPQPLAASQYPALAADGLGRVWVSWSDYSPGAGQIAVRMSQDNGASFGATYRAGRATPQGQRSDFGELYQQTAALPGTAFFVFYGYRSGLYNDVLFNAWDAEDFDRDGVGVLADCNDNEAAVWASPPEVNGLAVTKASSGTQIAWSAQASSAGPGTAYDLVSGWLSELRASRSYSGAYCLKNGQQAPPYTDTHPGPPVGDGYYYLLRGDNLCGKGTYGNASFTPDPRDLLDASGPCP